MGETYCAPAIRPLTRLHIAEDGADLGAPPGCEGLTRCGLVMAQAELWVRLRPRPDEQVCRSCLGLPEPPPLVQAALWPDADRMGPGDAIRIGPGNADCTETALGQVAHA